MGFVWERGQVAMFGTPEIWDYPRPGPRHRRPRPRRGRALAALAGAAMTAVAGAPHRARVILVTRPALADHRRAF